MSSKSLLITGTGTGVGKTHVTCLLASAAVRAGIDVGVMKPVASGCQVGPDGGLFSEDVVKLLAAAGVDDPPDLVMPVAYRHPLAPTTAADLEGSRFDRDRILDALRSLESKHGHVLVEGIGGLLVPLDGKFTVRDLAVAIGAPVLIVSANVLGTINHTALTVEAVRAAGLDVRGVVLNDLPGDPDDESRRSNAVDIERLCGVDVVARVPAGADASSSVFDSAHLRCLGMIPEKDR